MLNCYKLGMLQKSEWEAELRQRGSYQEEEEGWGETMALQHDLNIF